jgi:hypothetical protein
MKSIDTKNPLFYTYIDGNNSKCVVEHRENGVLIDELPSMDVANSIAILANLGHLFRNVDGFLCIDSADSDDVVATIEEYMEEIDSYGGDDGPTDQDEPTVDDGRYGPLGSYGDE